MCTSHHTDNVLVMNNFVVESFVFVPVMTTVLPKHALQKLQVVVTIYTPGGSVSDGAACEVKYDHSNGCYAIVVL